MKDASGFRYKTLRVEVGYQSAQYFHGAAFGAVSSRWRDDIQEFEFFLGYELAYQSVW